MTGLNPFDWYGGPFLALYAFLFIGAFLGSFAIATWLRPDGRALPVTDEDELAMLAGGGTRLGETVLGRLLARGAITIERDKVHRRSAAVGGSTAERDVLSLPSPFKWSAISDALAGSAVQIEHSLIDRGLMMEPDEARQLRLYAAMPFALLIVLGLIKVAVGMERDGPVGFLILFLAITAIVAAFRLVRADRRTTAGIGAVSDARQRSQRLRNAPTAAETGMAVALFGTTVLVGSSMAELHTLRRNGGDGGGGSSDGGDGGSGCGGGGCGGCGG